MTARRDRLGRGLGALLGEYMEPEADARGTAETRVPVGSVTPNPFQPRREFDDAELAELATSIRDNGLLQPIVVRPAPGRPGRYELVAGERRWRAVGRLGWSEIPAIERPVDDRTLLVLALVENLQRSQLSALEEALAFRQLIDDFDLTQKDIAEAVGRDRSTVANTLRLLQLPDGVRRMLDSGALTAGHARALLGMADDRRAVALARTAVSEGWSVRDLEAAVARRRATPKAGSHAGSRERPAAERRLEETLQRALDAEVRVRPRARGGGDIDIRFADDEDFERLFEQITGTRTIDVL